MADAPAKAKPRDWSPRLWEGSDFFTWIRLLAKNRFAVEFPYWYIAGIVSGFSLMNTCLRWRQRGLYGHAIDETELKQPPIFVIGHWRTGTTLLHELLVLDQRFTSPNTAHCFMPCHFLLSEDFFTKYLWFLMPEKRPMDNMAAGWGRPQEDEFALALLGRPSTYTDVAFPNRPALEPGSLDLSGLPPTQLRLWKRELKRFAQAIALHDPRQLVLKSPPHTARIPEILDTFPDAIFLHIKRAPYVLFASTVNLWNSLAKRHGFQTPRQTAELEEKVFREFRIIYERFLDTRDMIPAGRFCEIRYEDLVRDMMGEMKRVYQTLPLGDFEHLRPHLESYIARSKGYETNRYELTGATRERIQSRWGDLIDRLGYGR